MDAFCSLRTKFFVPWGAATGGSWLLAIGFGFWRLAGAPFAIGERFAIPSGAFPREDFPHVGDEQLVFPPRRGQGGEHAFALGEQVFPQRGIFDDADDFFRKEHDERFGGVQICGSDTILMM